MTIEDQAYQQQSFKYCENCGKQIAARAEICPFCGVRVAPQPMVRPIQTKSSGIAAVLSFVLPGLGQIYNGQIGKGILIIICSVLLWVFALFTFLLTAIIAIVVWLWSIYDAYKVADRINAEAYHMAGQRYQGGY